MGTTPPGWLDGAWPTVTDPTKPVSPTTPPVSSGTYLPGDDKAARRALLDHLKLYQYNRSVYIAIAAVGPSARVDEAKLKSTSTADWANSATNPTTGTLDDLWSQANWVCQQAKKDQFDGDWTELSFDNPPWQGIKDAFMDRAAYNADANKALHTHSGRAETSLLSAPLEYK
jgi:hypothetical protein